MNDPVQGPHNESIGADALPTQGPVSRSIVDQVVELTMTASFYGRAAEQARRIWPAWTLRRRREREALWWDHTQAGVARLCLTVGEPAIPDLAAAWADRPPRSVPPADH
jgi:hypothetical protein